MFNSRDHATVNRTREGMARRNSRKSIRVDKLARTLGVQHVRTHVRYLLGEALALALALLRPPGPGVLDQQYVNVVNSGVPISQKTLTGTVPYW